MAFAPPAGGGSWITNIGSLTTIIFRMGGVISITLIIILITTFGSLVQSVQQKSILPFVQTVGGKILNYDTELYMSAVRVEDAGGLKVSIAGEKVGFFNKVKYFFAIVGAMMKALVGLWYLYFFAFMFYKGAVLITNNSSAVTSNVMIMVLALVVLQIFANFIIVNPEITGGYEFTLGQKMTPFKGFFKFLSVTPLIFNPIYEKVSQVDQDKTYIMVNVTGV